MTTSPAPLGSRFTRLWAATATANLADGILLVGFPLLAVGLTRSPLQVSLVSTLATAPWLLVALHAGAIADRHDRRRIIVAAVSLRVVVLAALVAVAAAGRLDLTVIYAAVVLLGVAEVFADTTTQSILPMLVDRERLGAANGRVVAAQTVANDFLGGPIAGVLVTTGAALVVGVPAVVYAVAALTLLTLAGDFRPAERPSATMRRDIAEGLRYLAGHRVLRALAVIAGLLNLAGAAYLAVFVLWAVGEQSAIGLRPEGYGLLMAALAVGGTLGALVTERLCLRVGEPRALAGAAAALPVWLLIPVWSPRPSTAAVAFVAVGLTVSVAKVVVVSLAQRLIRGDLLGRVNAAYRLIGLGSMPLGAVAGGALASATGLVPAFHAAAGACLVALAVSSTQVTRRAVARAGAAG